MRKSAALICLASVFWTSCVLADDEMTIAKLEKAGARVERDLSDETKPLVKVVYNLRQVTNDGILAIKDLEELPAIEFIGNGDTEISLATLRALQGKRSLRRFALSFAKVSDEAASVLGALVSLHALELKNQVDMSPIGLRQIFNLTKLQELVLADRLVSDEVLAQLSSFPNLKILSVRSVFVSDQGVADMKRIQNLKKLRFLIGPNVTEVGVKHLTELNVTDLDLTYSDVTNAKLKSLRKIDGLKSLVFINASAVTDDAIASLTELGELKTLDLADAKLTKAGIAELKRELPKCTIKYQAINRD